MQHMTSSLAARHRGAFLATALCGALSACTAAGPAPYAVPPPPMAPVPLGAPPAAAPAPAIASQVLGLHNSERARVGVRPLVWDPHLAAAAAAYALRLAAVGQLRHSPKSMRQGQGENLWIGTRGGFSPQQMVGSWAAEKANFRPGIFPNVSRTGNWADVGHYTQMIWRDTQRLGCGLGSSGRFDVLVCRYAPRGNLTGRRVP